MVNLDSYDFTPEQIKEFECLQDLWEEFDKARKKFQELQEQLAMLLEEADPSVRRLFDETHSVT